MSIALFLMCIYKLGTGENERSKADRSLRGPTSPKAHMGLLYPLKF